MFWNRNYPYIDYSTGGSINRAIRAAEANLAKVTDQMIVIPGHGAVGSKADLVLFRDVLVEIRDKVAASKKQGSSLEQVVAEKPGSRTDEIRGHGFIDPAAFVPLVCEQETSRQVGPLPRICWFVRVQSFCRIWKSTSKLLVAISVTILCIPDAIWTGEAKKSQNGQYSDQQKRHHRTTHHQLLAVQPRRSLGVPL